MTNNLTITEIGTISSLGWTAPKNLSEYHWLQMGPSWGTLHKGSKFGIGDWLNHGEKVYGETYAEGADLTGIKEDLLMNYAWVSRSVPISMRRESLSYWHHVLVAPYSHKEIKKLLDKTEKHGWATRELTRFIKRWRRWVEGPPSVPKSRSDERHAGLTLPLFSEVKQDVFEHYPTATPHQASDLSRFVVDQLKVYGDNGKIEELPTSAKWKRLTRIALKARRGWKRLALRSEAENALLKTETAKQFEEILELNGRIERLLDPQQARDKDWREKILENY